MMRLADWIERHGFAVALVYCGVTVVLLVMNSMIPDTVPDDIVLPSTEWRCSDLRVQSMGAWRVSSCHTWVRIAR